MLVSFNSVPRKTMQHITLGSISKQMKAKKAVRSVDLQRADQPWPIWLLSLMKWLVMWTRGDQWISYTALSDSTHQSHHFYHHKNFSHNAYKSQVPFLGCKDTCGCSSLPRWFASPSWHFGPPFSGLPVLAVSCDGAGPSWAFCRAA